jgi:RNA polymerase sigma-70 factor (ECF subfamily)
MTADDSDKLLVARIRGGEPDAWQEVIDRFEGRLFAFIHSRLGNRAASEDAVQETFMGFLISLPNYDDKTRLETYLFSIAAHKLTDTLRREGRRPALPLLSSESGSTREPAGKARPASSLARSKESRVFESDVIGNSLRELVAAWKRDGEWERLMCMELLFVMGWPNKDVATRLGISEQAVANHKHFVVSKLKTAAVASRLGHVDLADYGIA